MCHRKAGLTLLETYWVNHYVKMCLLLIRIECVHCHAIEHKIKSHESYRVKKKFSDFVDDK